MTCFNWTENGTGQTAANISVEACSMGQRPGPPSWRDDPRYPVCETGMQEIPNAPQWRWAQVDASH